MGIDESKISKNIESVLDMMNRVFAKIGKNNNEKLVSTTNVNGMVTQKFNTSNAVADGIEAVQGAGQVIRDLGEGLKVWGDLDKQGIDISSDGKIASNIRQMITLTSEIFAEIGKNSFKDALPEFDGKIDKEGNRKGKLQEKTFMNINEKMGIEAMQGAGNEVLAMANALKIMSEISNPQELKARQEDIASMITAVADIFAKIGSGEEIDGIGKMNLENVKKGIEAVQGSGDELNKIVDAFMKFKLDKDQKGIDIEATQKDIAKMVTFSADLFNFLGGGESENLASYGIPKLSDKKLQGNISNGISNLNNLISGVEQLVKLNEEIQKLKGDNNKGLGTLTSQYRHMVNLIDGKLIDDKKLTQHDMIVKSIERLSWANKDFDKFQKSYENFEKKLSQTREGINKIDLDKFKAYNNMLELYVELAKFSKVSDMNKMAEGMKEFMKEFADGLEIAIGKSTDAMNTGLEKIDGNAKSNLQAMRDIMAPFAGKIRVRVEEWDTSAGIVSVRQQ